MDEKPKATARPDSEMQPLWLAFPYPPGSMGWRMGAGEHYRDEWEAWYAKLWPKERRDEYALKYPEPPEWSGFYASLNPQDAPLDHIVGMSMKKLFGSDEQ